MYPCCPVLLLDNRDEAHRFVTSIKIQNDKFEFACMGRLQRSYVFFSKQCTLTRCTVILAQIGQQKNFPCGLLYKRVAVSYRFVEPTNSANQVNRVSSCLTWLISDLLSD